MSKWGSADFKPEFTTPPLADRPWSYSLYATARKCMAQVKYKYIMKAPEAPRPASDRGTKIHDHLEQYVKGDDSRGVPLNWRDNFLSLRRRNASAELKLGVTRDWKPCDWFDPKIWIRAKLDANYTVKYEATVIDYKSGRIYDDHPEQADLYSTMAFSMEPKLKRANSELWYLDLGPDATIRDHVDRDEVESRRKQWTERITPILNATEFPAMPGRHCSWCGYSSKKGGPCQSG